MGNHQKKEKITYICVTSHCIHNIKEIKVLKGKKLKVILYINNIIFSNIKYNSEEYEDMCICIFKMCKTIEISK